MALLICPECKGKVSSTLKACPHCGYVMPVDIAIQDPEDFLNRADYEKYRQNRQRREVQEEEREIRKKEPVKRERVRRADGDTETFFFPDKRIKDKERRPAKEDYYEEEETEKKGSGCLLHLLVLFLIAIVFCYGMINYSKSAKEIYQKAVTTVEAVKNKLIGQEQ